jgi:hypothetical protein
MNTITEYDQNKDDNDKSKMVCTPSLDSNTLEIYIYSDNRSGYSGHEIQNELVADHSQNTAAPLAISIHRI